MPKINLSDLMGGATGAMACLTALATVELVRRTSKTCKFPAYLTTFDNFFTPLVIGCLALWCPCIVFGKNKQRLRSLQAHHRPLPGGGESCDGDCCLYCGLLLCGIGWVLQVC